MTNFLMIVEVIVSILLIVVVVAQNSKNAGMGGAVSVSYTHLEIILVVAEGEQEYMSNHIQGLDLHIPVKIVLGGRERQDSVA